MKVYRSQGIEIADKHLEIMICQMLRKVVVEEGNDTGLTRDTSISKARITELKRGIIRMCEQVAASGNTLILYSA